MYLHKALATLYELVSNKKFLLILKFVIQFIFNYVQPLYLMCEITVLFLYNTRCLGC